uniref:Uncharacterized protein n=1 Tax=Magnetospirillum gryphiswaldense TaxID=55518 RepID=Q3BK60_9PROT|nr:hypothetical protein mgI582 [Magnetospirillum gryphiswaldense MSR-1]CAM78093.1 hypothetical protein MGR_4161 [Magnetospirillum gryphiswaldense MSR-1]
MSTGLDENLIDLGEAAADSQLRQMDGYRAITIDLRQPHHGSRLRDVDDAVHRPNRPAPTVTLIKIAKGNSFHDPLPLGAFHCTLTTV